MKAISSLVLALLAIFSVFQTSHAAILINKVEMVANADQYSIARTEYTGYIRNGQNDQNVPTDGSVTFYLPGREFGAYDRPDCITATGLGTPNLRLVRGPISSGSIDGFTSIQTNIDFLTPNFGRSQTVCSFIAPYFPHPSAVTMISNVKVGGAIDRLDAKVAIVRPKSSVVRSVEAFINPIYAMSKPTAFKMTGIDKSSTPSKEFVFRNPFRNVATTGSTIRFYTYYNSASCDAYWDGVLYKKSAVATVIENGNALSFVLGSPLNSASEIIIYCPDIRGSAEGIDYEQDIAKYFPTALEFSYDNKYSEFTIAITPSYPTSASFETGFSEIYPFAHFTPKSIE